MYLKKIINYSITYRAAAMGAVTGGLYESVETMHIGAKHLYEVIRD